MPIVSLQELSTVLRGIMKSSIASQRKMDVYFGWFTEKAIKAERI